MKDKSSTHTRRFLLLPQQIAPGRYTSGSYLRLIHPFLRLAQSEESVDCTVDDSYHGDNFDAVIIERIYREDVNIIELQNLIAVLKRKRVKIVYAIDDDLYDLFVESRQGNEHLTLLATVCFLTRAADAVICPNEELADTIMHLNPRVFVFQNYLSQDFVPDLKFNTANRASGARIKIGYMGTTTHLADFRIVIGALKEILFDCRDVTLHLVGVADPNQLQECMRPFEVYIHQPPTYEYSTFIAWFVENMHWDIALAPLEDTPFNRCKSDLKFLDYSAIGAAGVYSNVPPYADLQDRGLGLVVDNTADAWYRAIRTLIGNPGLRNAIRVRSHQYLRENRLLEDSVYELRGIMESILVEDSS